MSDIEWTDATWNVLVGCSRVSPGCENCYAERFVHRGLAEQHRGLTVIGKQGPRWTGEVRLVESALAKPLSWRKPKRVFVNSLSDLWHEGVSDETVARVFAIMMGAPHLTFQILTKRPARMREWFRWIETAPAWGDPTRSDPIAVLASTFCEESAPLPAWVGEEAEGYFTATRGAQWPLANVWLGVTAEDQQRANERIPILLGTPAAKRFVSYEPALGPVDFTDITMRVGEHSEDHIDALHCDVDPDDDHWNGATLDWLIVGGESGPGARPFDIAWARSAVAQCKAAGVPVFVKQLGAVPRDASRGYFPNDVMRLKHRKGADMSEWPEDLRVREFPT